MVVQFTKAGYWRIQFLGRGFERQSSPLWRWPPLLASSQVHLLSRDLNVPSPCSCVSLSRSHSPQSQFSVALRDTLWF